MAFLYILKEAVSKAWYDTVMPLADEAQRSTRRFKDYFLGAYLGALAFIPALINPLRRPPAFLLNVVVNLLGTGREAFEKRGILPGVVFMWMLEAPLRAAALLFRLFTSPVESFFAARAQIETRATDNPYVARTLMFFNILVHAGAVVGLLLPFGLALLPPFWIVLPIGGLGATMFTDLMEAEALGVMKMALPRSAGNSASAVPACEMASVTEHARPAQAPPTVHSWRQEAAKAFGSAQDFGPASGQPYKGP